MIVRAFVYQAIDSAEGYPNETFIHALWKMCHCSARRDKGACLLDAITATGGADEASGRAEGGQPSARKRALLRLATHRHHEQLQSDTPWPIAN